MYNTPIEHICQILYSFVLMIDVGISIILPTLDCSTLFWSYLFIILEFDLFIKNILQTSSDFNGYSYHFDRGFIYLFICEKLRTEITIWVLR